MIQAAVEAVQGARQAAEELRMSLREAEEQAKLGVEDAIRLLGFEGLDAVSQALSEPPDKT